MPGVTGKEKEGHKLGVRVCVCVCKSYNVYFTVGERACCMYTYYAWGTIRNVLGYENGTCEKIYHPMRLIAFKATV